MVDIIIIESETQLGGTVKSSIQVFRRWTISMKANQKAFKVKSVQYLNNGALFVVYET